MIAKLRKLRTVSTFDVILISLFTCLAVFMSLPIVFIFNHAFKPQNELFLFPPQFFVQQPTLHNFETLFLHASNAMVPFTRYLFNSLVVVSLTLVSVIIRWQVMSWRSTISTLSSSSWG